MDTESEEVDNQQENIERELERLERENALLKTVLKGQGKAASWLGKTGIWVFSIAAIVEQLIVRISLVGLIAIVVPLLTLLLLWRETNLIREQIELQSQANATQVAITQKQIDQQATDNEKLLEQQAAANAEQVTAIQEQIDQQATADAQQVAQTQQQIDQQEDLANTNRRAELLATLYNRRDCPEENVEDCPLQASIRARAEAAKAFVELEKATGNPKPDLSRVDLSGANLTGAILVGIILVEARLISVTLVDTDLPEADLRGSSLHGADLREADLRAADLRGTDLSNVNLNEAVLVAADLRGGFLFEANLFEANLSGARYNEDTIWPEGFDPEAAGAVLVE